MGRGPPDLRQRYRDARRDAGLVVVEGFHALKHAIRFGAKLLDVRTRDPDALARLAAQLAPDVASPLMSMAAPVPAFLFDELAPSPHPTGVIGLAERPAVDPQEVLAVAGADPVVLLDRPTHHGNIGAVVRVAAAAGAAGVLTMGPHDPWHPASVRGAAGLQFALPVAALDALPETDRAIVVLAPDGAPLGRGPTGESSSPLPPRSLLVFGSERRGVGRGLRERAALTVAIPMRPGVSSLNLATAVAVTLFCAADTPSGRTAGG